MHPRYRPPPAYTHAPDPAEHFWLTVTLPDGMFVAPPDAAALPDDEASRTAEAALLAGVAFALALLVVLISLAAAG